MNKNPFECKKWSRPDSNRHRLGCRPSASPLCHDPEKWWEIEESNFFLMGVGHPCLSVTLISRKLERATGIEPVWTSLARKCLTIRLRSHLITYTTFSRNSSVTAKPTFLSRHDEPTFDSTTNRDPRLLSIHSTKSLPMYLQRSQWTGFTTSPTRISSFICLPPSAGAGGRTRTCGVTRTPHYECGAFPLSHAGNNIGANGRSRTGNEFPRRITGAEPFHFGTRWHW